jgi:ligand-binding SRPBCC domain-containing protein
MSAHFTSRATTKARPAPRKFAWPFAGVDTDRLIFPTAANHFCWRSGPREVALEELFMGVCRYRALISATLPQLWDFVSRVENLHVWGPAIEPVKSTDRPMQAGDRVTFWRRDFFRRNTQDLMAEEVIPQRLLRFRDLSPSGQKANIQATLSVEASGSPEATWIEEQISYSFGNNRVAQGLDRWIINPMMQLAVSNKTAKVFRRLEALFKDGTHSSQGEPRLN